MLRWLPQDHAAVNVCMLQADVRELAAVCAWVTGFSGLSDAA